MHANQGRRIAAAVLMAAVVVAAPVPVLGQDSSPDALAAGSLCAEYQVVASVEQPLTPELLASTRDIVDARLERFGTSDRSWRPWGPTGSSSSWPARPTPMR